MLFSIKRKSSSRRGSRSSIRKTNNKIANQANEGNEKELNNSEQKFLPADGYYINDDDHETESETEISSNNSIVDDEVVPSAEVRGHHPIPSCAPLSLKPSKKKYEIAIIACGCFWNPQRRISRLTKEYNYGIKRVIVGYVGGQYQTPTFDGSYKSNIYRIQSKKDYIQTNLRCVLVR